MGAQKLLKTSDRGQTWQEISPDVTKKLGRKLAVGPGVAAQGSLSANDGVSAYGNITTISESPKAAGTIWVGTDDGNVQVTTNGGVAWTDVTRRLPFADTTRRASYVSTVLASRHDARTAYAALDGHWDDDMAPHLFRTTDGGATWTSIAGDLPNGLVVRTIEEHPRNPKLLFVGTEFGLYWTFDGGRHWTRASGNMPPVRVDRIILNDDTNDLIVGNGRGVRTNCEKLDISSNDGAVAACALEVDSFGHCDGGSPCPGAGVANDGGVASCAIDGCL
jgi:hypothetical protein